MNNATLRVPLLGLVSVLAAVRLAAAAGPPRLVDMFAKAEEDDYLVHIIADGDISDFRSTRKPGESSYRLVLDVPALPPVDGEYDIETPFSRDFRVWPMKLGKRIYTRIEIELDATVTTVVGSEQPHRLFVRIARRSPRALAEAAAEPAPVRTAPVVEASAVEASEREGEICAPPAAPSAGTPAPPAVATAPAPAPEEDNGDGDSEEEFFSLFPAPSVERPLFAQDVDTGADEAVPTHGIRLGRLLAQPSVEVSWIRGTNLLLRTDRAVDDEALLVRARAGFELLASEHTLRFGYEARYRRFRDFRLDEKLSHFLDVETSLQLSPVMVLELSDRFVRGAFEASELDPGQEIFFNVDPFYRNTSRGALRMDLSERLGIEFAASHNRLRLLEEDAIFFDHDTAEVGFRFLYHLSPLSSLFGEYARVVTPRPEARPEAESTGDGFYGGLRGEITPLMTGSIRVGFLRQDFPVGPTPSFRGLSADASLTRFFSETAALILEAGRGTRPSSYESNGYYTSTHGGARFVGPVGRDLRITAGGSFRRNEYPLPDPDGVRREDRVLSASAGLAYFFTSRLFVRGDYRHERRTSTRDRFEYRNDVVLVMVGLGYFTR